MRELGDASRDSAGDVKRDNPAADVPQEELSIISSPLEQNVRYAREWAPAPAVGDAASCGVAGSEAKEADGLRLWQDARWARTA